MASFRETVLALFLVVSVFNVTATGYTGEADPICENVIGATINEEGVCVCEEADYIIDSSLSHCIPDNFVGWGSDCEDPLQCRHMGHGGVCKNGSCSCTDGYHYLLGSCWKDKKHGEKCSQNEECYAYFEFDAYVCSKGHVCECAAGAYRYREKEGNVMCRRKAAENEECETNEDCWDSTTICEKRNDATDFVCKKQEDDTEASPALISTSRTLKNSMHLISHLNETKGSCSGPNEVETPGGKCVCENGYFKPKGSSTCYAELGTPCSLTKEAEKPETVHIEFASCRRSAKTADPNSEVGVWACLGGFLPDRDNHQCQKTRNINQNCFEDVTCAYFGGVCNGKSCICPDGFHYEQSKSVCWPSKGIHEECVENFDCGVKTDGGIECVNGHCECKKGYHEADGDCRKEAQKLGDKCTDETDCTFANGDPLVICQSTCKCDAGYFKINNTNCGIGIGGSCRDDFDCAAVNNATCVNETSITCQCDTGFVSGGSTQFCYPVATEYEEECEEDEQCTPLTDDGDHIECTYDVNPRVCRCESGYYYKNNLCWEKKHLGEECNKESQCFSENSYCFKNLCACRYGFKRLGDECVDDNGANTASSISFILLTLVFAVNIIR